MLSTKFLAGFALGYVVGGRGGRERYDRIVAKVRGAGGDELLDRAREVGVEAKDRIKDKIDTGSQEEAPGQNGGDHGSSTDSDRAGTNGKPSTAAKA